MAEKLGNLLALDAAVLEACLDRSTQFLVHIYVGRSARVSGTAVIRARDHRGKLQVIHIGEQPRPRGGLPFEALGALAKGVSGVTIGPPERSLLNDSFLQDTSLLSGSHCDPPCWQNVVPGQASLQEASDRISAMADTYIAHTGGSVVFRHGDGAPCRQIVSNDGEIIGSLPLQFAPTASIGPVIAARGAPEYVYALPFTEGEAVLMHVYPAHNMLLSVVVPGWLGQLHETSPVIAAMHGTNSIFAAALEAAPLQI